MSGLVFAILRELGIFRPSVLSRVVASFLISAAPVAALTVDLHGATIDGQYISIGNIGRVSGINADEARRLESLTLGFAPPPGRSRIITPDTVKMRLLQEGFLPQQIAIRGEEEILVARNGQTVPADAITAAVLKELTPRAASDVVFQVVRPAVAPVMPVGELRFTCSTPSRTEGQFYVLVDVAVGDEVQKVNVTLKAVRPGPVVVALKRADRGAIIRREDLGVETRDLFEQPRDVITNADEIVGRVLTRPVQPGFVLTESLIEEETLVKRGDRVRMIVRGPGIELTSAGEAFESGGIGKVIRVRNVSSNRILSGRISGAGEVVIE